MPQRQFLAALPYVVEDGTRLYVHSEAAHPPRWRYVRDAADAGRSMIATSAHVTFCGHIHRPALYSMSATAKMTSFVPVSGVPVQLLRGRQWLAVLGSVGQPRDGDPRAGFGIYDAARQSLEIHRTPYPIEQTQARIREAGLPEALAQRLAIGR